MGDICEMVTLMAESTLILLQKLDGGFLPLSVSEWKQILS